MAIGFEAHDHQDCITSIFAEVEGACERDGLRLTAARRRVLEILVEAHSALGAYQVLERLKADGWGDQPPVVYRALDFLRRHGFVHRIEHLNAFVACTRPGQDHKPAFLICNNCARVAEAEAAPLDAAARTAGFQIETTVLEARGLCPLCREDTPE